MPVRVRTRLFGTLALMFTIRIGEEAGSQPSIAWSRSLPFPGLRAGEVLAAQTALPRRATLLARDGSVLAESPRTQPARRSTRSSPLGELASAVLGSVGPVPSVAPQSA